MSIKRNFSIGLLSSIWNALLGLAVVPMYLKYLGTESYGLIGFFATTQAVLQLLDLGLSPTINREVARCSASDNMHEARSLLHTLAVVYWAMAAIIALIIGGGAPLIAGGWLQSEHLSHESLTHAVMLMGMVVASRWPVGLYMGALMGMQRIALSSTIGTVAGTLSSLGGVIVVAFISKTIEAFFIWQCIVGLIYAFVMRWIAWHSLGASNEVCSFSLDNLKRIWRFSAGMSSIAVTGVILIQIDKLMLSRLLNLDDFGRYMLAGVVANGLYILLTPLFNSIYPRMTALISAGEIEKLSDLYIVGTRFFLGLFFPVVIVAIIFCEDLLFIWTRNQQLATSSVLVTSLLLVGTALNGVMHFPYALQLANGETRLPLKINLILIATVIPMTIGLASTYGTVGGAGSWALLNALYFIIGTYMTHRLLLKGIAGKWLLNGIIPPLFFSFIIGGIGLWFRGFSFSIYIELTVAILLVCVTFFINIIFSSNMIMVARNVRKILLFV